MRRAVLGFAIVLALNSWASVAFAQAPGRLSLDISVGRGFGSTEGVYRDNHSGLAADLLAAVRLRPLASGGVVAALGAGVQGTGPITSICIPHPSGGCVPSFPEFRVFSGAVGWEMSGGRVRGLVGPAAVHADATAAAVFGRVDIAAPLVGRVWFLVSARAVLVPDYRDDSFRLGTVGIGVRIR